MGRFTLFLRSSVLPSSLVMAALLAAAPAFAQKAIARIQSETASRATAEFDISQARAGGSADLPLPGGLIASLNIEKLQPGRGGMILQGHAEGEHAATTLLSINGASAYGEIRANGRAYSVDTYADGVAHITDVTGAEVQSRTDAIALPADAQSQTPPAQDTAAAIPAGNSILDVGLFYTDSMSTRYGIALGARMNALVDRLNMGLSNSNVPITAVLADLEHIDYSETATLDVMLPDLRNGVGTLAGIATTIRNAKGLDIISAHRVFNKDAHNSCGLGYVPAAGALGTTVLDNGQSGGFNVVDDGNDINGSNFLCSIYTFAHETGHNMGLTHNREDATQVNGQPQPGVFPFSFGWRQPGVQPASFRTIMSYASATNPEPIVPFFSDPDIVACGNPVQSCGRPITATDAADNAESLRLGDTGVQGNGNPHGAPGFRARANGELFAATLPYSRSVQVGGTATAFATIINSSSTQATNCGIALAGAPAGSFTYQTTNPATNAPSGTPNTPVNIPANGLQTFFFAINATATFSAADLAIQYFCSNRRSATTLNGLNTLLFGATNAALPDIVALADTPTHDGVLAIGGVGQSAAFAMAIANVGAAGAVTATVDDNNAGVADSVSICQTNAGGQCLSAPSIFGVTTASIPANGTATFAIFATATGAIPFDPAANRIFVRFKTPSNANPPNITVGATSVAVRTP